MTMPSRTFAEVSAVAATCSAVAEAVFENDASKASAAAFSSARNVAGRPYAMKSAL